MDRQACRTSCSSGCVAEGLQRDPRSEEAATPRRDCGHGDRPLPVFAGCVPGACGHAVRGCHAELHGRRPKGLVRFETPAAQSTITQLKKLQNQSAQKLAETELQQILAKYPDENLDGSAALVSELSLSELVAALEKCRAIQIPESLLGQLLKPIYWHYAALHVSLQDRGEAFRVIEKVRCNGPPHALCPSLYPRPYMPQTPNLTRSSS